MDDTNKNKFLSLFLQTSQEHISHMRSILGNIQSDTTQTEALEDFHRAAHSLKGECRAMGFQMTGNLAYLLELTFYGLKNGSILQTPQLIVDVSEAVDTLESSLTEISSTGIEKNIPEAISLYEQKTGVRIPVEKA